VILIKEIKISLNKKSIFFTALLVLVVFGVYKTRTLNDPEIILDYDPWFQYRHAEEILKNNLKVPEWDLLSFFPPGRPFPYNGWQYTIILFYKIMNFFSETTFMKAGILAPAIMTALACIPAYLLGKQLTNEWGGIFTAIFATLTPTFIGVSMAGYSDTDVVVVFYTFLSIFSIFLSLKKKKLPFIALSIISNILFIINWWFGWYPLFFFMLFIPSLIGFRLLENLIFKRTISLEPVKKAMPEIKIILVILVVSNIFSMILGSGNIISFIKVGLGFTGGAGGGIVNVSVAELQPINILTRGGFMSVARRVGRGPILLFLIGLPLLIFYKFYKKENINLAEIFLFMWSALTFYLILHGVRFSLLFSCASSVAAGYVIGNLTKLLKKNILSFTVFGVIGVLTIMFISEAVVYAYQARGMEVSQNWVDMLDWLKENADPKAQIATWWDPGHIIAGYAGLRVHADGAHCSEDECIPYGHNTRIQDMGRMMTTTNETETVELLEKYRVLTEEECNEAKEVYGDILPEEGCEPASEIYFIASSDLIGKYTWMNYFGGFRAPIGSNQDFERNPGVCCPSTPKTEPGQMSCGEFADQGRGVWVWCPWIFSFQGQQQDQQGNPVYVYDYSGLKRLKMAIVQQGGQLIPIYNNKYVINNLVFYSQDGEEIVDLSDIEMGLEKIDGMLWVDPNFQNAIYFAPSIKDSIFTELFFFNGKNLENFELVFSNSEIKLFKVNF
jgi:asparagine N-glycosylation enzyme membrane subunit Stt3